ncbi:MAG: DUF4153 domain-containing protein [Rhodospirillaceae bacterium]
MLRLPSGAELLKDRAAILLRGLIGFVQGLCLYIFYRLSELSEPLFGYAEEAWLRMITVGVMVALFAPLPALFGVTHLPRTRLALWSGIALVYVAAMGAFNLSTGLEIGDLGPLPFVLPLAVLYIAHEFVISGNQDGQKIARYETFFDNAWSHAFQAGLAGLFLGLFWLVLALGAWLFALIELTLIEDIIYDESFALIASPIMFALGVHLTDAERRLTRGTVNIALSLSSWIAILMTLVLGTFLIALLFTGVDKLWEAGFSTALALGAAILMIFLINAAYQDGETPPSKALRAVIRFSALPLTGLLLVAAYGLWLRTEQYGLSPSRVLGWIGLILSAWYALGYVAAAAKPGPWMALLRPVNIGGALVVMVLFTLMLTPILNPARVTVSNQIERLTSGDVSLDRFDFAYLTRNAVQPWGRAALEELAATSPETFDGDSVADADQIPLLAQAALDGTDSYRDVTIIARRQDAIRTIGGTPIPPLALMPQIGRDPVEQCVSRLNWKERDAEEPLPLCLGRMMDLEGDGTEGLLLWLPEDTASPRLWWIKPTEDGAWQLRAHSVAPAVAAGPGGRTAPDLDRSAVMSASADALAGHLLRAQPLPSPRQDLVIGPYRIPGFDPSDALWQGRTEDALAPEDAARLPDSLTRLWAFPSPLRACQRSIDDPEWDTKCYSRVLDYDGDGQEDDIAIIRFSGIYELSVHMYTNQDSGWHFAGTWEVQEDDVVDALIELEGDLSAGEAILKRQEIMVQGAHMTPTILPDLSFLGLTLPLQLISESPP